jgi:glycosyltransferase involved in cell wall biosynthesis
MSRGFRKRVLFLAPYLGDGGINTHMLTLASDLTKLGWEVAVCSGGPLGALPHLDTSTTAGRNTRASVIDDYEQAGITHFEARIPARPHRIRDLTRLLRLPVATWQVIRAVRQFRPALLHSHSRQMGVYARLVQVLFGLPFVSTVHTQVPSRNRLWSVTDFLGAVVVAVSGEIQAILIRDYGVKAGRVRVVAPGADSDHFRPASLEEREAARQHYGIRPGQFALAFVGSMNSNKRPETLVEAAAELVGSGYDVVVLVAGQGPAEEMVRVKAATLGLADRVQLLGYQDTRRVLWAADTLVLPSRQEGSPLVVVEAMLSGVAVVRTAESGADQQITPNVTGVVFAYGDHEGLARRVAALIDQPDDRNAIAASALDDARTRFTSMRMARTIEEVYLTALEDRR